jgi:aryl-alcohol dehydrogenase-like predicted oxidoreductase
MSSVLIYGGAALDEVGPNEADKSIEFALENGINHFDTSDDYGDSEVHLGRWMPRVRDDVFLATKTTERTRQRAAQTIRRSLERLNVERVDLIQLHAICDLDELDEVTTTGGALEAAIAAHDEGLAGGIGITGHGRNATSTHLEAIRRFSFDTVLTPYSYRLCSDAKFRSDFEALAEAAQEQDVALMLIKYAARNLWRDSEKPRYTTWYEPLDEQRHIDAAVAFALRRVEATGICTPGDIRLLPKVVAAEGRVSSVREHEMEATLSAILDYETPFISTPGRSTPEWLREPV